MKSSSCLPLLSILILISCSNVAQTNTRNLFEFSQKYRLVPDWPQLPNGYLLGDPSDVGIDNKGDIIVFHRASKKWPALFPFSPALIAENTILVLDRATGKIKTEWGSGVFVMPHSLTVDKDDNIWITDVGLHQVMKFNHEGKLLMTLGIAGVPGDEGRWPGAIRPPA